MALVRRKAAAIHYRRRVGALGAGALTLLLIAGGIALAGNGGGAKRTLRTAGPEPTPTTEEITTTTTEAPTTVLPSTTVVVASTSTTMAPDLHWHAADGSATVDVTVTPGRPKADQFATFTARTHNDHGALINTGIDWGDGSTLDVGLMNCDMIAIGPDGQQHREGGAAPDAPPADTTDTYRHAYRRTGTYHVTLSYITPQCEGTRAFAASGDLPVGPGLLLSNGPEPPTLALSVAQGIVATGTDDDGYVRRIVIDWGDGSPKSPHDFPLSGCLDDGRSWPSVRNPPGIEGRNHFQETIFNHTYAKPGHYIIRGTVTSSGCTGADPQQGTGTLDFDAPPPGP